MGVKNEFFLLILLSCLPLAAVSQVMTPAPLPYGPTPGENQLRWQQMEYYAFVHLSVNTYTDMAWGLGNEDPHIFNPKELDCRQWARICKQAGMKGIIITAKHHSGFCLWPSKYTEYSVKNSPGKKGRETSCARWPMHAKNTDSGWVYICHPGIETMPTMEKPEYITYFRNQLTELLTNYGDVFEVWV